MSDFNLSKQELAIVRHTIDELQVQSMLFDMDIDYETASLVEKRKDEQPQWLKRWKERLDEGDFGINYDVDWE